MSEFNYAEWLKRWAPTAMRLRRIGVFPFGYDPDYLCEIKGVRGATDIPEVLAEKIGDLVKKAYPETQSDKEMIKAYKKLSRAAAKKVEDVK